MKYKDFWKIAKNDMMTCQYNYTGYYAIQVNYISNNIWISEDYSNIIGSQMNSLNGLGSFQVQDESSQSTVSFSLT